MVLEEPFQAPIYSRYLSPTPAAMARKLARPMAAAKPKKVVECDDESSCEDFVFEDDFWEWLGKLNHMFTFHPHCFGLTLVCLLHVSTK